LRLKEPVSGSRVERRRKARSDSARAEESSTTLASSEIEATIAG
jgi:hypothetical protein